MMTNVQARTATRSPLPPLTERTRLGLLDLESNQNKRMEIDVLLVLANREASIS